MGKRKKSQTKVTVSHDATPFSPHRFNTQIVVSHPIPKVYLSPRSYHDMILLVSEVSKEVGWLGTVREVRGGFYIDEVFLVKQEVAAATTELDEDGISELGMALMAEDGDVERANRLRFWGHSHVRMDTSPSGQDNDQMDLFRDNGCDHFIRGIANKEGKLEFTVYYFKEGIIFKDVPWTLYTEPEVDRLEYWQQEIADKVTEKTYSRIYTHSNRRYSGVYGAPQKGTTDTSKSIHNMTDEEIMDMAENWNWLGECGD